jgi:maltooligosyltrehalose trehalohydrolase
MQRAYSSTDRAPRRIPAGAEVQPSGDVHFRVWAPASRTVFVAIEGFGSGSEIELAPEDEGYFSGSVEDARAGTLYRYRFDDGNLYPDPASRFQPQGPHGPSQVIDPEAFEWTDGSWPGSCLRGQVLYEMHIGTFTRDGTFEAAGREIPELADLGITAIEIMPIAEFPGRFGWGYDGVDLFAPYHFYGGPDDLRSLVDRAHSFGIGVILDVVYNHLGPDGNYLPRFSPNYFTGRHKTDWGPPVNLYGKDSWPVRSSSYPMLVTGLMSSIWMGLGLMPHRTFMINLRRLAIYSPRLFSA